MCNLFAEAECENEFTLKNDYPPVGLAEVQLERSRLNLFFIPSQAKYAGVEATSGANVGVVPKGTQSVEVLHKARRNMEMYEILDITASKDVFHSCCLLRSKGIELQLTVRCLVGKGIGRKTSRLAHAQVPAVAA